MDEKRSNKTSFKCIKNRLMLMYMIVKNFDISNICTNACILINTENYDTLHKILEHYKSSCIVIITKDSSHFPKQFYENIFKHVFIYDELNDSIYSKILQRQHAIMEREVNTNSHINTHMVLLLDNISNLESTALREILFNGRYYDISVIIKNKNPSFFERNIGFDYVCLFDEIQKEFYNNYVSFTTYDEFEKIYDEIIKNNKMIVINQQNDSKNIIDRIFYL